MADSDTLELLDLWHAGDREALGRLLERHLPWIERRVSARLGPELRARAETRDYLQDAVLEVLRWVPRFRVADGEVFRRLLARLVENVLRDQSDRARAQRRALDRERPLAEDTVLDLRAGPGPATQAAEQEMAARLRLALALMSQEDRQVVIERQWEGRSWQEIGVGLGVEAEAARMRGHRALARLARSVESLEQGRTADLLADDQGGDAAGEAAAGDEAADRGKEAR